MSSLLAYEFTQAIRDGRATALSHTQAALGRVDAFNPMVNACTVIRRESALHEAGNVPPELACIQSLHGVPIIVKEEYDVKGDVTSLGGAANITPATQDAPVISRLRNAGAVIIARSNMPEFGQTADGYSAYYGPTRNPWNRAVTSGGSSAGSAAAVATQMVPIGMGADGGGSLRVPASACGIFGLKPTRGRVSSAPLPEHWHGLATFGAMTRSAFDMATVLDVISGNEDGDVWTLPAVEPELFRGATEMGAEGKFPGVLGRALRILHARNPILAGTHFHSDVAQAFESFAGRLMSLGHDVRQAQVRWPNPTPVFLPMFASGMNIEAEGVQHPELLHDHTRRTATLGAKLPAAIVAKAVSGAVAMGRKIDQLFASADLIITPTLPVVPGAYNAFESKGWVGSMQASTPLVAQTAIFNVSGHPAASIHAGFSDEGVPIGIQVVARLGREDLILALAAHLETHGGLCPQWDASRMSGRDLP